jgi:hypothetical protein
MRNNSFQLHLTKWDSVKANYIRSCIKNGNKDKKEIDSELLGRLQKMLMDILEHFLMYGKYKDKLVYYPSPFPYIRWGQFISGISEKLKCEFLFGIEYDGFFLSSSLSNANHIKNMNDEFWRLIAELPCFGRFTWNESTGIISEPYKLLEKKLRRSGSILKFAAHYIFQELEETTIDMGTLELKWKHGIEWKELLENGEQAFNRLYKANYFLYKKV